MKHSSQIDISAHNEPWIVVLVFLIALLFVPAATHTILDHPPEYDELLHVLAARGISENNQPSIADGVYPRAVLFTKAVSIIASQGSSELILARLPALVFGALLVAVLGAWVCRKAGWVAGLSTAAVLTMIPETPHLSSVVRFYTVHALLMIIMLISVFEVLQPKVSLKKISTLSPLILITFFLGIHFQILTMVTALGCCAGAVALIAYDKKDILQSMANRYPWITIILAFAVLSGISFLYVFLGVHDKLRGTTPAWSIDKAQDIFFYIKNLTPRLPMLWPLFPVLVILAWIDNRRITLYFLVVFIVCLAVSSIASQKATRYVYHFMPVIALIMGLGMKSIIRLGAASITQKLSINNATAFSLAITIVTTCLLNTVEAQRLIKLVTGKGTLDRTIPLMQEPDWQLAAPTLLPYINETSTIISSSGIKSLYALGRYDYELSRTVIDDTLTKTEFGYDGRTGRLVISTPESVNEVLSQEGNAIIVLENRMIDKHYGTPANTMNLIKTICTPLHVPLASQLSAWTCN